MSPVIAPAGQDGARVIKGIRGKSTSASPSPENSSAESGVTGPNQRRQECNTDPVSLLSITSCSCWPLCIKSFARLSKMDRRSFQTVLMKVHHYPQRKIVSHDFLRFQHMMTEGLQAIRGADDADFLVGPFKVMLSGEMPSPDALLLSLVIERVVPGFLSMLGESFVGALLGIDRKHEELITAITELLAQICQEDECWLDRLGWNKLSMRQQCNLFSSIAFVFKHAKESGLTLRLHEQVSLSWLEKQHYATVQRLTCNTTRSSVDPRDLKASVRAICFWLEARFFVIAEDRERHQLIDCFARFSESITKVMERLGLQPDGLLLSVWQVVTQCLFFFRNRLSDYLAFDRIINLLWGSLQHIHRWATLERLAFELRLTLLGIALLKCEALLRKRNTVSCSQVWLGYENMLEALLAKCNEFMRDYQPPFRVDNRSIFDMRKKEAQINLELKESWFSRLDCQIRKMPRQRIQDNLLKCRTAFGKRWKLSHNHLEIGTIELAQWCFLAGEYDAGVRALMSTHFESVKLGWRKGELLAHHCMYQAAVDEFRRIKALMTGLDEVDQHRRDQIDDQVAMTQLRWYQTDDNTDHLISAYQLSVDLLGRCNPQDRARYEGGLAHIVNAMKNSGLRFEDYVEPTLVLDYLVKEGCGIKSWRHFSILLHTRHKLHLTDVDIVHKVVSEIDMRHQLYLELGKKS